VGQVRDALVGIDLLDHSLACPRRQHRISPLPMMFKMVIYPAFSVDRRASGRS
jgi:hypothetical protein